MIDLVLHKFYAASISIGLDGTMLIASSRDRLLIWGMVFCFVAALSLIGFLIWRRPAIRRVSVAVFIISLSIPVFIMPSASLENIHITRDQMTIDTGNWYQQSTTVVALGGLHHLSRESSDYMISNLIGDAYVTWHFERANGSVQNLILNDFFSAHSMTIAHYIRDRGYSVEWLQTHN